MVNIMPRKNAKGRTRQEAREQRSNNARREPEKYNKSETTRSKYDKHANGTGLLQRVSAKSERQEDMLELMKFSDIVIAVGPPGTGKTAVATLKAAEYLHDSVVTSIVVTRPIVEIGKSIGALPGDVNEKYAPYLVPFIEHFVQAFGEGPTAAFINDKKIRPVAVNFCQGMTLKNSILLIDEAQNLTQQEMFMILTRVGEGTTVVIMGDLDQIANESLRYSNGLKDLLERVERSTFIDESDISLVKFTVDDNVRSGISKKISMLYS
jgi:phosphate starvation-inducible PhoH-like protein